MSIYNFQICLYITFEASTNVFWHRFANSYHLLVIINLYTNIFLSIEVINIVKWFFLHKPLQVPGLKKGLVVSIRLIEAHIWLLLNLISARWNTWNNSLASYSHTTGN